MGGDDLSVSASGIPPGAITQLLETLAKAPSSELGGAWDAALYPGSVVGKFELLREIGRGGFGVVWEAKDRELGRHVAFKAVRAGRDAASKEERLVLEAEAAARLSHPNIVALFDLGRSEHGPFLVLELLRGTTLADRIGQGPLPAREAVSIAVEIAKALAHAHAHGVTHRDLKPANVFLRDEGTVKVLDFGLSHAFGQRRTPGGTPAYMAPEQLEGGPEDERTDVFALGVTIYEMLMGRRPFAADRCSGHRERAPAPVLDVPDAPALGVVIARLLATRAVDRPRDGAEVLDLLLPILRALQESRPSDASTRERRKLPSWAMVAIVAAAFLVAAAAVALVTRRAPLPLSSGERVVVAVADFANETGDRELDGLSGLLTTSLQQSPRLRVLTRGRMLDLLPSGSDTVERLDERRARDAGRRAGVGALVLASVRRLGDVYVVEVRVLDPVRDEYVFTTSDRASGKANVLGSIDHVAERTRAALHESPDEIRHASLRVADVAADLEAYQAYFEGKACVESSLTARQAAKCLPSLERAVAKDPSFALAWLQLAAVRMWLDPPAVAREAIENAVRSIGRAPPREAVQIQALAAQIDGREAEAAALFHQAAAASPDDRTIQFMAADFFLTRGELEASLPYWRRGAALDPPGETVSAFYLVKALGALGRREELEQLGTSLSRAEPTRSVLKALCRVRAALGDGVGAADAARRADDGQELTLLWLHGFTPTLDPSGAAALQRSEDLQFLDHVLHGRYGAALAMEKADGTRWVSHNARAQMAAALGRTDVARADASHALTEAPATFAGLAVDLALAGDLALAEEAARGLFPDSPRERTYRAVVHWKRGDPGAALELVERLVRESPWTPYPSVMRASVLQAEILADLGRDADAIESLSRYRATFDPGMEYVLRYPRVLFLSARSHERLGNVSEARAAIDRLLLLWKDADADLPLLADARALRQRLDARAGRP